MKYLSKFLGIYLAFLLQSLIVENIKILNCSPDILLVAVIICSVSSDFPLAATLGAFAGLLVDALQGHVFGVNILIYMYFAMIVSMAVSKRSSNSPLISAWICFISIAVLKIVLAVLRTMLGYPVTIGYLGANIFVQGVFGAVFALLFVMTYQKLRSPRQTVSDSIEEEVA